MIGRAHGCANFEGQATAEIKVALMHLYLALFPGMLSPMTELCDRAEALVLFSGGIDSFALAYLLKGRGFGINGVFVDYGQAARHPEWDAAQRAAHHLQIPVMRISCDSGISFDVGELSGRNLFLASTAAFFAPVSCTLLAIGIHAGVPYYDCSPVFVERLKPIIEEQSNGRMTLITPFLNWHKPQIVRYAIDAGLPLEATYSCESGSIPPCGSCASCRDREALGC